MARVAGKVALVTGGARGIGESAVRLLVAEGANVVVTDILDTEGKALVDELGEDAVYVHHDVTDRDGWQRAMAIAKDRFGGLDVLVNNAGMATYGPIDSYEVESWQRLMDVNVNGVFYGIQAAVPLLRDSTKNASVLTELFY